MKRERILIVDDHPLNLKLAADVLSLAGYQVSTAANAEQALTLLHEVRPDAILMDLAMPGMDGLALTRLLRNDSRLARVPIIALTASAMKGDDARALDAGCNGYITKPIDTRTLPKQVAAYIEASTRPRR
jgi:CheY-like chemotaxis protein